MCERSDEREGFGRHLCNVRPANGNAPAPQNSQEPSHAILHPNFPPSLQYVFPFSSTLAQWKILTY